MNKTILTKITKIGALHTARGPKQLYELHCNSNGGKMSQTDTYKKKFKIQM